MSTGHQWLQQRGLWLVALVALPLLAGALALWLGWLGLLLFVALLLPVLLGVTRGLHKAGARLQFYRTLFDESNDAIFIIQDGQVRKPNPAACKMSGYAFDELDGMDYSEIVAPADRLQIRRNHVRRIEGELPANDNYRFRLLRKDGSLLWVQLRVTRLMWRGRPAVVCMLTNVDEAERAERKMRDVRKLDAMMEVSGELAQEIRQWLAMMKEESRQLLEAENEDHRLIAWRQLRELFNMVQNTLTMLERTACMEEFRPRLLDLEALLSNHCMQRVNQRSGVNVQLLFKTRKTRVFADQDQLLTLLQFILDELMGHPGESVEVQITLSEDSPDEETRRAFEMLDQPYLCLRFSSLNRKPLPDGPGRRRLLYNTVRALALRNGGVLFDELEDDQRVFHFYLPPSRGEEAAGSGLPG